MAQRSDGDSLAQRSSPRRHAAIVAIAVCSSAFAIAALAAPVDDLRTAVEAGDSAAAYARHCATSIDAPERPPEFDLWCGVAAVDIGRSGEGVLALERYVLQFPDDARARLELARAYFYAGDDVRSREEFEAVARSQPPPEVQAGIDRYLAALTDREARYRGRRTAFVELGGGYDSNANAGVAQAEHRLAGARSGHRRCFRRPKRVGVRMAGGRRRDPPSSVRRIDGQCQRLRRRHVLRVGVGIQSGELRRGGWRELPGRSQRVLSGVCPRRDRARRIALSLGRRRRLRVAPADLGAVFVRACAAIRAHRLRRRQRRTRCRFDRVERQLSAGVAAPLAAGAQRDGVLRRRAQPRGPRRSRSRHRRRERRRHRFTVGLLGAERRPRATRKATTTRRSRCST